MFNFFKASRRLLSSAVVKKVDETVNRTNANINLYCWDPYPKTILGVNNKPLLGHLSGGAMGHISIGVFYSDGTEDYVSIWAKEYIQKDTDERVSPVKFKIAVNSKSLKADIEAEYNRQPHIKSIAIDEATATKLKENIKKLNNDLEREPIRDVAEKIQWGLTNNCATFVCKILYETGVIYNRPGVITTPHYIFSIVDEQEQKMYLENYKTPSFKD